MADTQGLRPFDPYRTLQLHPAAPRDLVEKTYWLLASSVHSSPVSGSRIQELNAAYAMLVDDAARRSYDEGHGVRALVDPADRSRSPRLRLFSAKKPGVDYDDYYHVLRIDSEADSRIIQLAYDFWTHGLQGARVERERIEEAHRTLSNPQLRAQYDARRAAPATPQKVEITEKVHGQIQNARHNGNATSQTVPAHLAKDPRTAPSVETPPASRSVSAAPPGVRPVELLASAGAEAATETPAISALSPAEPAAPQPAVAVSVEAPPPPAAEPVAPAAHASLAPLPAPSAHPLAPATRLPAGRQLAEAQQNRLLQLREDAVTLVDPAPAFAPAAPEQLDAPATLAFISGPRTGERIELAADVTLGSDSGCAIVLEDAAANIEREHARLMRRGATYMFSDVAGHDTMIAGRPPALPVVLLEDADEIQIGVHRMRFATPMLDHRPARTAAEAS